VSLTDLFDMIFVINLPSRADRRREMAQQLARIGLHFDHPRVSLFSAVRPEDPGGFESIGARGCFLSHLEILRTAHHSGFERILIFEDDLNFEPDFDKRIDAVLGTLARSPWSIFYGGYETDRRLVAPAGSPLSVVPTDWPIGTTYFVGIQSSDFGEIVSFIGALLARPPGDPQGGPMHVDGAYSWYRRANPHRITLAAVPRLGRQRSSRTDVHELRWYDKAPFIRESIAGLRRVKNRLLT
jgi:glycosyl transferase family 25